MAIQSHPGAIRFLLPLVAALIAAMAVGGQTSTVKYSVGTPERFPASRITWRDTFGYIKNGHRDVVYCFMTQGSFRAPTSPDLGKLSRDWLDSHPKAEAVLVYTLQPISTNDPNSQMKSMWIVDGQENLNLYLVRKGACPAGTMVLEPGDETPLTKEEYEAFEKKVWEAEKTATAEKLGIWAQKP